MSQGVVHRKASLILAAGFSVGALLSQNAGGLECALGAVVGIMVSPDLDVNSGNISYKIIRKKVGWFGESVWRWFWSGYSGSFKHGQFASHFPIFSTLIRLFYIYFWVILVPHTLIYFSVNPGWDLMYVLSWFAKLFLSPMFFYGLVSSDIIHWALDLLTKETKK